MKDGPHGTGQMAGARSAGALLEGDQPLRGLRQVVEAVIQHVPQPTARDEELQGPWISAVSAQ